MDAAGSFTSRDLNVSTLVQSPAPIPVPVYMLMGTCGSGKTSIAELLAAKYKCRLNEADEFHSAENIAKMSRGEPLADEDRWGWLEAIRSACVEQARQLLLLPATEPSRLVLATCSALKTAYRRLLSDVPDDICRVTFVYLKGTPELIAERMRHRKGHFMGSQMLTSQLVDLQEPDPEEEDVVVLDISEDIDQLVGKLVQMIETRRNRGQRL